MILKDHLVVLLAVRDHQSTDLGLLLPCEAKGHMNIDIDIRSSRVDCMGQERKIVWRFGERVCNNYGQSQRNSG